MARFLAFVFFAAATTQLYFDWTAPRGFLGGEFQFAEIGAVWTYWHYQSFELVQGFAIDMLNRDVWEENILPALFWPLVPCFYALSVLFWIIRRRKPRIAKTKTKDKDIGSGPVRRMR